VSRCGLPLELFSEQHDRRTTISVVSVVHAARPIALTLIERDLNPISARTLERSELWLIPLKLIHELIETDLHFARAMVYQVVVELRDAIEDFGAGSADQDSSCARVTVSSA
jgi:hypothetical protein